MKNLCTLNRCHQCTINVNLFNAPSHRPLLSLPLLNPIDASVGSRGNLQLHPVRKTTNIHTSVFTVIDRESKIDPSDASGRMLEHCHTSFKLYLDRKQVFRLFEENQIYFAREKFSAKIASDEERKMWINGEPSDLRNTNVNIQQNLSMLLNEIYLFKCTLEIVDQEEHRLKMQCVMCCIRVSSLPKLMNFRLMI
ncbi:hypothetical protein IGI04_024597 [Brassica rapa subsp. trilocularis]|uniref:Uncharacterized protein n=1 Tax=Brassica rapa subsp. trilocularis TaxID=1813537 RepID=A0ABQ7MAL8_BRACM|nr:hypothetical protein IGI04_024597 [Brassica rapa subsp. trilocularis]